MTHLSALTVCVNYADLLSRSIARWKGGCDEVIVVTAPGDAATRELCARHGVRVHVTDVFYAGGAKFNKFAAMEEAAAAWLRGEGAEWVLLFDSDIVPPRDWRAQVERARPACGRLYGARRWAVSENAGRTNPRELEPDQGLLMPQGWVLGFFSLFHVGDGNLRRGTEALRHGGGQALSQGTQGEGAARRWFEVDLPHAGWGDTFFTRRWPRAMQVMLPLRLLHLGEERQNWFGRENRELMAAALKDPLFSPEHCDRERIRKR